MLQDISATERAAYAQKIMRKEDDIDDLRGLERNFQERNDQFIFHTKRYFEASEECFYHRNQFPSQSSQWQQNVIQGVYSHMRAVAEQQNEALETSCRSAQREIEQEIEDLHKERNALEW